MQVFLGEEMLRPSYSTEEGGIGLAAENTIFRFP